MRYILLYLLLTFEKGVKGMAGIRNQTISWMLRKWLQNAGITQKEAAERLNISQPTLSRQLKGIESIPFERIKTIAGITNPDPKDIQEVVEILGGRSLEDDLLAKMHLLLDQNGPDRGLLFILEGWHLFRKEKKDEILELVRKESFWLVHGEGQYHVILQQYPKEKREILLHKYKNLSGIFNALGVKDGPESIIDVIEKLENAYQEIIKGGGSM